MGVSGCGKTTIGSMLADRLGMEFHDADRYHPESNILKIKSGIPLTDRDREPWLLRLADIISEREGGSGVVLACSALKEAYREILSTNRKDITRFIHLTGPRELILRRMNSREGHYFPPHLLDSQYDDLEEPDQAISVAVERSPEEIIDEIIGRLVESRLINTE
jgi:carbohydrate kinase (thermoresistant glucokinase family)